MPKSCPSRDANRRETWVMKQNCVSWEQKPTKQERMVMQETMRNAKPSEVGGNLRRIIGARDTEESMKRVKFKHERRRFGNEQESLSLEDAMAEFEVGFFFGFEEGEVFENL